MDLSTTRAAYTAAQPDLNGFMQSWTEASAQASDASTALAREALAAGMQWLEEGATTTEQWLATVGSNAHRFAEAAREAAAKATGAADADALWATELELAGNAAQMAGASLQDLWATLVEQQSQFAKSAFLSHHEVLQRLYRTAGSHGVISLPAAPEGGGNGIASWFDWMNQATRAVFDVAAGAAAAAQQAVAPSATEVPSTTTTPPRGRSRARVAPR